MINLPNVSELLSGLVDKLLELLKEPGSDCVCDIPPPCWYPQEAGHAITQLAAGGVATIVLKVRNRGPTRRTIKIRSDTGVLIEPAEVSIGPLEVAAVTATLTDAPLAPPAAAHVVWVLGGQTQYVLWEIVDKAESLLPTEFAVEDQPDYLHHWYDHFYCAHPPAPPPWPGPGSLTT